MSEEHTVDCEHLIHEVVGRHHGIIKHFKIHKPKVGEWPFYFGCAEVCDVGDLNASMSFRPPAGGIGETYEKAFYSIVGEVIERYCASFIQAENMLSASYNVIKSEYTIITPNSLSCFSESQHSQDKFPYSAFIAGDLLLWQKSKDLFTQAEVLVPAAYVYIPYSGDGQTLIAANSTGLACGENLSSAIESAIYETFERDAYSLCWLYAGSPPRLDISGQLNLIDSIPCYDNDEWLLEFYDLTGKEGVPVILCVLQAPRSYAETNDQYSHWYCHGVASHINAETALLKAFREAMLAYYFFESKWQKIMLDDEVAQTKKEESKGVSDPVDFDQHAMFYNQYPHLVEKLHFLEEGKKVMWGRSKGTVPQSVEGLSGLLDKLQEQNVEGIYVDLTTDDVRELNMISVRVLLKGFTWLHGDNRIPHLGTERALHACKYYDYIRESPEGKLNRRNPWPHSLG